MNKLESDITQFSLNNALVCAEVSRLAYASQEIIKKELLRKDHYSDLIYFDQNETQAFMCADEKVVLIAFRGTESIADWQTDLNAKLVPYCCGKVHRGFKGSFDLCKDWMLENLEKIDDGEKSVWVTGHSLGGALSVLAVDCLMDEGYDISGLYTFGQPRVGNAQFAEHFDAHFKSRSFRFVNDEDIVTRVPPRSMGYRHIGVVRYFDQNGHLQHGVSWWRKFLDKSISVSNRTRVRFEDLQAQYPGWVNDHSMDYYIKHVKRAYLELKKAQSPASISFKDYINS